jgi:predicted O-methyltransferase YrrM
MFADIPAPVLTEMQRLEALEQAQRRLGVSFAEGIRALVPSSARVVALLAAAAPADGALVEIGSGAGYSTLWLTLAVRARTPLRPLVTIEADAAKARMAQDTFAAAGVSEFVALRIGDCVAELGPLGPLAFAFLDHSPDNYARTLPAILERLVPGGILVADNVESHRDRLASFLATVMGDPRLDAVVLPVGKGLLLARRC